MASLAAALGGRPGVTAIIGTAVVSSVPFLIASIAPALISDLYLTPGQIGLIIGASYGGATLGSPVSGRFTQRFGWATAFKAGLLGSATALLAIALLADSAWVFAALMFVAGFVGSVVHPAANTALAELGLSTRQAYLFGLKQGAIPAALAGLGILIPRLLDSFGWRPTVAIASGAMLVTALPILRAQSQPGIKLTSARRTLGPLTLLAAAAFIATLANGGLVSFYLLSMMDSGLTASAAGLGLTLGGLAAVVARLVTPRIALRNSAPTFGIVSGMMVGGVVGLVLLGVGGWLAVPGTLLAFGLGWGWTALFHFGLVRRDPATAAYASGIVQAGFFLGGGLGSIVFGWVIDATGTYGAAWGVGAVAMFAASLITYSATRRSTVESATA